MFLDVFVADAVDTISVAYWLTDTLFPPFQPLFLNSNKFTIFELN